MKNDGRPHYTYAVACDSNGMHSQKHKCQKENGDKKQSHHFQQLIMKKNARDKNTKQKGSKYAYIFKAMGVVIDCNEGLAAGSCRRAKTCKVKNEASVYDGANVINKAYAYKDDSPQLYELDDGFA